MEARGRWCSDRGRVWVFFHEEFQGEKGLVEGLLWKRVDLLFGLKALCRYALLFSSFLGLLLCARCFVVY